MLKRVTVLLSVSLFCSIAVAQAAPPKTSATAAKAAPKMKVPAHATVPSGAVHHDNSPALKAYCGRLWNKIVPHWYVPDGNNLVTVTAIVAADGNVESVTTISQPKCPEAENSALTAFEHAKPLEAIPGGIARVKVSVTFKSKADPHGDSSSSGSVKIDPVDQAPASAGSDAGSGDAAAADPPSKQK
jgi:hypothetical protein